MRVNKKLARANFIVKTIQSRIDYILTIEDSPIHLESCKPLKNNYLQAILQ
jgi:hypothetical protein